MRTAQLSRHGILMYVRGLQYLGKVGEPLFAELTRSMAQNNSSAYWYWDESADQAIYANLLLDR